LTYFTKLIFLDSIKETLNKACSFDKSHLKK
jgi:hypothetical protein